MFDHSYCDTDHYLVMAKVRDTIATNKQRFRIEMLNFKNLSEVEGNEQRVLRS
jgi:hypothetical protein